MAQRRKQPVNASPSARNPNQPAPAAQPGAVPEFQGPPGWMQQMKEAEQTPGTPQYDAFQRNAGAQLGSPQDEGDAMTLNIRGQSAANSAYLNNVANLRQQAGDVALENFYGVERPQDNTAQQAVDFMRGNTIDPATAGSDEIDRAFGLSEGLINSIMNTPSQTKLIGDQVLSNQLALGRSSPGGIGNVQAGVKAAMGAAPQLQQQAQQASIQEQVARASAATGAAQIYAGVAQGTADRAVRIGEANQNAANNVLQTMTQKYGQELNFTTEQRGQFGQLARDFYNNQAQFAQMDLQQQQAAWEAMVRTYGIDATLKAAMEQIAAQENIGPLDAFKLVLGGIDAVGSLVPKPGG